MSDNEPGTKKSRILIVDDELIVASNIRLILQRYGYEIAGIAGSAEEAIRIARESLPDLILMDISLKDSIDGIETAKIIREFSDSAIVFLTAYSDNATIERARSAAPYGYLIKPLENSEMYSTIEMALYKHSTEKLIRESENKYRSIFENVQDVYYEATIDGILLDVSPSVSVLTKNQYKREELLGESIYNLYFDEGKRSGVVAQLLEKGSVSDFEISLKNRDGSIIRGAISAKICCDDNGKPEKIIGSLHDISERKFAEEKLRESELQFRTLFEKAGDGIIYISANTDLVQVNESFARMHGYTAEEMKGMNLRELDVEDLSQIAPERMRRIENGEDLRFDVRHYHKEGHIIDLEVSSCLIMIGKEKLFVAFHRDITERKRAEAALRDSEQLFRRISDLTSDYIFTAKICDDGKLRLDFVLGAVEKITGYSIDEYKASDHWRILLNLDDVELDRHNSSQLINNNKVISEIRTVHKNGNTVWLRIYENPVRDEKTNKLVGVSCAVQDITERKLTEEELRKKNNFIQTVLDNLPMGVALNYIDEGDAFYINKKFEEIYGWPKEEMADISSFFKKVYPDETYRNELLARILSDINSGDASRMHWENCVVTHKDGSKHVINAVNIPLFEQNTMVSTVFDITERVRTEEELSIYHNNLEEMVKARTDELNKVNECLRIEIEKEKEFELMLQNSLEKEKELNEIKTRFISTTSHEFRTPLTSVLSSTELLQRYSKKWSEDKLNVHFDRIKSSVEYLVGLLDEILTISRADRGRLTFNPEKVDLKTAANEYIEDARSLIKDHQLILNYQSGITQFLLDPKLLKFMISNLLSNAIKYSPDGGNIELKIKTDENQLIIEVADEGMGIPVSDIGFIFQSFFRSKNAEEIAGTGLGLSIVKLAVDRHGGDIMVKSEIDKGSIFTIRIPI